MNKTVHDTTHACKKQVPLITLSFLLLFAVKGGAEVVYENDFSTRTSKEPIPATGVWQTAQPYPNKDYCLLACRPVPNSSFNGSSTDYSSLETYFHTEANSSGAGRPCIDGWFMPYFNSDWKLSATYYTAFSGSLAENPVMTWHYGNNDRMYGTVVNQFHNEFTNGELRVQVDMKAPVKWDTVNNWVRVFPVYRKYLNALEWSGSIKLAAIPGMFHIGGPGEDKYALRSYPRWIAADPSNPSETKSYGSNRNDQGSFDDGSDGKTNYWFRSVLTYNLGSNTFSGEVFRFSKSLGHPGFDTPPSDTSAFDSVANAQFITPISAESGGIAGLAVSAYGSFKDATAGTAYNKVFVDNIRLSWKAPGATDFEVFYENDFTTRRYRTLSAPSTMTGAFSQLTASVNETDTYTYPTFSGNLDKRMLIPGAINGTTASQPVGLDGWKKLPYRNHSGGSGNAAVHAYGGTDCDIGGVGTNMLTYGNQGHFSTMGQTLGKVFTTGKVKISVDARLPEGNRLTESIARRRMAVGLGSLALYDAAATSADACAQIAAGFGYHRLENIGICSSKPYTLAAYTSGDEPNLDYPASYTAPETNAWYRMVVEADLDARTYDVSMTPLGTTSVLPDFMPVESPIFTATALPFAANVTDIGSFYLYGYGYGAATTASYINSRVCFDNIRVWHDSDLIYENDFTTRTRTLTGATREMGDLAALQYNLDGGQDHWVRRDYIGSAGFDARAWVRDDNGNKFLSLGRSAEAGRTITLGNSLGCSIRNDFRFEVDIRPPSQWSDKNGTATISLGDSQMAQTEAPESVYGAHKLISFGFSGTNTASSTTCPYYFAGSKAQVGGTELDAEIDPTHWYRFRLKVNTQQGSYDVELRDMGTAHPTAETVGGTVVATAKSVSFANALSAGEGVSTIHIEGDGLAGSYGSLGVDPGHVLIDNIKLSDVACMVLVFR